MSDQPSFRAGPAAAVTATLPVAPVLDAPSSDASGASMWTRGATPLYLAMFVALGLASLLLGPSLSVFRARTGLSRGGIGVLFTVAAGGYLVGSLVAGQLLDRIDPHRVIGVGCALTTAGLCAVAFSGRLWQLVATEVVLGFGNAMMDTSGNTLVLWLHRGGPVMSALHSCFALGGAFAPGAVALSDGASGELRIAYLCVAAVVAVSGVVIVLRPGPAHPHADRQEAFDRSKSLLLVVLVLCFVSYVGVEVGFIGWAKEFAIAKGFDPNGRATALNTAFLVAFLVGRLGSIPLSARMRPARVLGGSVVLCVGALALLIAAGSSWAGLLVGASLFGIGTAPMFAAMLTYAEPYLPSTGAVTSAVLVGASVGSLTVPPYIGHLLDVHGPAALPWAVLSGTLVCAAMIALFGATARAQATPD